MTEENWMPAQNEDLQRYHDRDLLIGVSHKLDAFQKTVDKLDTDMSRRFSELRDQINGRMDRLETTQERLELRIDKVERDRDVASGGLGFGRWLLGLLIGLPFFGALVGVFVGRT